MELMNEVSQRYKHVDQLLDLQDGRPPVQDHVVPPVLQLNAAGAVWGIVLMTEFEKTNIYDGLDFAVHHEFKFYSLKKIPQRERGYLYSNSQCPRNRGLV